MQGSAFPFVGSKLGVITASGQTVALSTTGFGTVVVGVFGTYGAVNLTFEASMDNSVFSVVQAVRMDSATVETVTGSLTNTTRMWRVDLGGAPYFRARATAYTSGSQSVYMYTIPSLGDRMVVAQQAGTWNIATVTTVSTLTSITNAVTVTGTVTAGNTILGSAGACSIGKFEDAGHTTGDTGVFTLAVRNDTAANPLAGTDLDYIPFSTDNEGNLRSVLPHNSRSDTYTTTASGTTITRTSSIRSKFGILVKGTGTAATTWDVRVEGSLDGVNFTQILQHTNADADGANKWTTTEFPCLYFRSRCAGLTLGTATNIVVTIVGSQ